MGASIFNVYNKELLRLLMAIMAYIINTYWWSKIRNEIIYINRWCMSVNRLGTWTLFILIVIWITKWSDNILVIGSILI